MAKMDIYKVLKGDPKRIADFKENMVELLDNFIKDQDLKEAQRGKIARLRAYIEINFKDF